MPYAHSPLLACAATKTSLKNYLHEISWRLAGFDKKGDCELETQQSRAFRSEFKVRISSANKAGASTALPNGNFLATVDEAIGMLSMQLKLPKPKVKAAAHDYVPPPNITTTDSYCLVFYFLVFKTTLGDKGKAP